jgi:hypothetical protein
MEVAALVLRIYIPNKFARSIKTANSFPVIATERGVGKQHSYPPVAYSAAHKSIPLKQDRESYWNA